MFCTHCGARFEGQSRFCGRCGHPVSEPISPPAAMPVSQPEAEPLSSVPPPPESSDGDSSATRLAPETETPRTQEPAPYVPPAPPMTAPPDQAQPVYQAPPAQTPYAQGTAPYASTAAAVSDAPFPQATPMPMPPPPPPPGRKLFLPLLLGGLLLLASLSFCTVFFEWYTVLPWFDKEEPKLESTKTPRPEPTPKSEKTPRPTRTPSPAETPAATPNPTLLHWDEVLTMTEGVFAMASTEDYIFFLSSDDAGNNAVFRTQQDGAYTELFLSFESQGIYPRCISAIRDELFIAASCYVDGQTVYGYFRVSADGGELELLFVREELYSLHSLDDLLVLVPYYYGDSVEIFDPRSWETGLVPIITEEDTQMHGIYNTACVRDGLLFCVITTDTGDIVCQTNLYTGERTLLYSYEHYEGSIYSFCIANDMYWVTVGYYDDYAGMYNMQLICHDPSNMRSETILMSYDTYLSVLTFWNDRLLYAESGGDNSGVFEMDLYAPYHSREVFSGSGDYQTFENRYLFDGYSLLHANGDSGIVNRQSGYVNTADAYTGIEEAWGYERPSGSEAPSGTFDYNTILSPDGAYELLDGVSARYENGEVVIELEWAIDFSEAFYLTYFNHGAQFVWEPETDMLNVLYAMGDVYQMYGGTDTIRIPYEAALMGNDFYISFGLYTSTGSAAFALNLYNYG